MKCFIANSTYIIIVNSQYGKFKEWLNSVVLTVKLMSKLRNQSTLQSIKFTRGQFYSYVYQNESYVFTNIFIVINDKLIIKSHAMPN